MKKMIYLFLAIGLFTSCMQQKEPVRYFSASPEIDVAKSLLKTYVDQDWESLKRLYADTAKILNNVTKGNGISVDKAIEEYKRDHDLFSSIQFISSEDFYEKVITDDGENWVNYWGIWVGSLKATNQKYEIPVHITMRFIDGKIVTEHGYWNNADIAIELYKLEALTTTP